MASATIYESQWKDRYMTFDVTVSGTTASWTLTVAGDAGKWYATGATTCKIGNTTVYSHARSSSGFPAVVGSQSGTLTVTAGQTYECSIETAIYTSSPTKKTFSISAQGGGGGDTSARAATVIAQGGELGTNSNISFSAYNGTSGQVYDYVVFAYISANGGNRFPLFGGVGKILQNGETKSFTYQIPTDLMKTLGDSSVTGTAEIEAVTYTYLDTEEIGELVGSNYYSVSVQIPRQTLSIGSVSVSVFVPPEYTTQKEYTYGDLVTRNNVVYYCISTTSGTWNSSHWTTYSLPNLPLANRTFFQVAWNGATASDGSYISKVKIEYARIIEEADNPAENGIYVTGVVPASGTVEFYLTVYDARGFYGTASGYINLLAYEKPQITEFIASRWNETTNRADDKGTSVHAGGSFSVSELDGYNHIQSARISNAIATGTNTFYEIPLGSSPHDVTSGNFYTFRYWNGSAYSNFNTNVSYLIKIAVTDTLNSTTEKIVLISTEPAILDFKYNGKGLAIGKVSETDNLCEIAMDLEANNGASQMSVKSNEIWLGTANGRSASGADGLFVNTQLGTIVAQSDASPTQYKQIRNIFISERDPSSSDGNNGDVWVKVGGA